MHEITLFGTISQTTNLFFISVIEIIKGIMIAKMLSKLRYFFCFLLTVVWNSKIRVANKKYGRKSKEF
jgi:hypothetical protein